MSANLARNAFVQDIMDYEEGSMPSSRVIPFFSGLLQGGLIPHLQSHYGRVAGAMVGRGILTPDGTITDEGQHLMAVALEAEEA